MAYNGKFTSLKMVVEKAFRDAGIENVDWEAAIEWTTECMSFLGVPYTYENIVTNNLDGNPEPIAVVDYKATLPVDLVNIISLRRAEVNDEGNIISTAPMVESNDIFQETFSTEDDFGLNYIDPTILIGDSYYEADPIEISSGIPNTYSVNDGNIFTNFKEGNIEMAYRAYPIDNSGYPKIPEDLKFQRALEFYIIYKLDWKRWRAHPAQPGLKAVLNDSEQKYYAFAASARTKAHIPSVDKMESLKSQWLRLIPKPNEHATGFNTTAVQEVRYNRNS